MLAYQQLDTRRSSDLSQYLIRGCFYCNAVASLRYIRDLAANLYYLQDKSRNNLAPNTGAANRKRYKNFLRIPNRKLNMNHASSTDL